MTNPELAELFSIAKAVAVEAGDLLRAHRDEWTGVASEEGREVKVDADTRAEAIILDRLRERAPLPILSEEAGWVDAGESDLVWAVDPLDGSINYIRGYPHCAVSIALLKQGKPVIGVVDCFLVGELFSGVVGQGAWVNDAPIQVSVAASPAIGILQTGIPARARSDPSAMAELSARMAEWRKVRMIGSAASALAYVAAGRAEAYRESGSMLWDVAGGCALVEAAGGQVRIVGDKLDAPLEVSASNGQIPLLD